MSVTPKALIQAQFVDSTATAYYTAPGGTTTLIDKLTATNTDGSTRTLTVYLVASGGSSGSSTTILQNKSLTAGSTADLTEIKNHILNSGDSLVMIADVASKVVARASGREVR